MKKFLLTLSMFSAVAMFAKEAPAVDTKTTEATPAVDTAKTDVKADAGKVETPKVSLFAKAKSYVPSTPAFVTKSVKSVENAIIARPWTAVAVAAVVAVLVVKAIDHVSASEDEDDNF